jgi:hypothetical protein
MYDTPLTIEQILTNLAETPARLAGLTEGLTPAQLLEVTEPGEWSARDGTCRPVLICGEAIVKILSEEKPTFKAVNPLLDQEDELCELGLL